MAVGVVQGATSWCAGQQYHIRFYALYRVSGNTEVCYDEPKDQWYLGAYSDGTVGSAVSWWDGDQYHIRVYVVDGTTINEWCNDNGGAWYQGTFSQSGDCVAATAWFDGQYHIRVYVSDGAAIHEWCVDSGSYGGAWRLGAFSVNGSGVTAISATTWYNLLGQAEMRVYVLQGTTISEFCLDGPEAQSKWYTGKFSQSGNSVSAISWYDGEYHTRVYVNDGSAIIEWCWDNGPSATWFKGAFSQSAPAGASATCWWQLGEHHIRVYVSGDFTSETFISEYCKDSTSTKGWYQGNLAPCS